MSKLGRPSKNQEIKRVTKGFSLCPINLQFIINEAKKQGKNPSSTLNSMIEIVRKLRGE